MIERQRERERDRKGVNERKIESVCELEIERDRVRDLASEIKRVREGKRDKVIEKGHEREKERASENREKEKELNIERDRASLRAREMER